MRTVLLVSTLVLPLLVTAGHAQDKGDIQKLENQLAAALTAGDAAAAAAIYAEDALLMPPDAAPVKGRAGIEQFWKGMAEAAGNVRLTTVEARPLGSEAVAEVGTWAATLKGDKPKELAGKYLILWRKAGADWRIAVDIWNDGT
jgi:uncharacterized protein (TIGR02246 family)